MPQPSPYIITPAHLPDDIAVVRALFREYIDSLNIDLSFQDVEAELADLPGKYAPPTGSILLAHNEQGAAVGCIALRPLGQAGIDTATCELKRLYVRPEARGHALGHHLASSILDFAKNAGYTRAVLDTLASMHPARNLYTALGFQEVEPYYNNPIPEAVYYARQL